jgi:hypothetical protein
MSVCLFFVLSGRGLCDGLVSRPEESYRVWCVIVKPRKKMTRPRPPRGCRAIQKQRVLIRIITEPYAANYAK